MPEKEYIERDAVIEIAKSNKAVCSCLADIVDVMQIVNDIPTADVQPVVHAHWICIGDYDEFIFECSNCHDIWRFENGTPRENNVDYCFSCGAKMDGNDTYDKPT